MLALRRGLTAVLLAISLAAVVLTVLLAVSPPWIGLDQGWQFQPATLVAPLRTYLFRQAVLNTLRLAAGTGALTLLIAAGWARLGPSRLAPALTAFFFPGALAGLLWRPLFPPIWYSQAETALLATGLVIVWQAAPLSALLMVSAGPRRAWPLAACVPIWLALTGAGLTLTLTGGEPFNASHTWASWALTALWVSRAWGHAAAMFGGLALVTAAVMGALLWKTRGGVQLPTVSKRGWDALLPAVWVLAPLAPWIVTHGGALVQGLVSLALAGAGVWTVSGLVFLFAVFLLARASVLPCCSPPQLALALGLWTLWPVPAAYLAAQEAGPLLWAGAVALAGLTGAMIARRPHLAVAAACALLAHAFPLLLVLDLPDFAQPAAMGAVMRLGGMEPPSPALAAALCLSLAIAACSAFIAAKAVRQEAESVSVDRKSVAPQSILR